MSHWDVVIRIALGFGLGCAIGIERQWRAKNAGLRTNALVCLGATLFVIMGAYSFHGPGADPTRVAAQIVSGIGFLGAGVIMKQGATITGLNTAATMWATAAVGALAGGGIYEVAILGAAAIVVANLLLRPLGHLLDRQPATGRESEPAAYLFEVTTTDETEAHIRALTVQAVSRPEFALQSVRSYDVEDGKHVRVVAKLSAEQRNDSLLESAVSRLSMEPAVSAVRWHVDREEEAEASKW
ncbi:putative Mg2+ transporter-C (MgtC) family protein [Mycobacteroides chelonae]|nr:putative Mg2+ transporter-C (MgtC) family protein [Mycobacteroides chelonae]